MPVFRGVDLIDFETQLNDEENLVRQSTQELVDSEISDHLKA
jgi:hypothetical protein